MEVILSESLKECYPNIKIGILEVRDVVNKKFDFKLEEEKRKLEIFIRENYKDIENIDIIKDYNKFFKKYGKTYPIQFQIKSIVKGKSFPTRSTIVEAMFMAELKNMYLTAGHDLDSLKGILNTKLANGTEECVKINGERQKLELGDIITMDDEGIISSVLYGPDYRTQITNKTKNCLFFSYFLYGENNNNIKRHFKDIMENIRICSGEKVKFSEVKIYSF